MSERKKGKMSIFLKIVMVLILILVIIVGGAYIYINGKLDIVKKVEIP